MESVVDFIKIMFNIVFKIIIIEATYSSMVECLLMVQWVVGLIPHHAHIELLLIPASAPQLV